MACIRTRYDEASHLIGEYNGSGVLIQETVWLGDLPVATIRPNGAGFLFYYVHATQLNAPFIAWRSRSTAYGCLVGECLSVGARLISWRKPSYLRLKSDGDRAGVGRLLKHRRHHVEQLR